jgi:hypothetical protein
MSSDPLAGVARAGMRVKSRVQAASPTDPPPPLLDLASQGLRHQGGGAIVAARAFAAGETVLVDDGRRRPVLLAPLLRPSNPAYKPLDEYFRQTHVPASVVLKLAALLCAVPPASELLDALPAPGAEDEVEGQDGGDDDDNNKQQQRQHPVHAQARDFAAKLRATPPPMLPAGTIEGWPPPPDIAGDDNDDEQEQQQQLEARWRALWTAPGQERRLARGWLLWSLGGRPTPAGSALCLGPAALHHRCRGANTAYVPASSAAPSAGATAAVGRHVALRAIAAGEPVTTCLLGTGRDALLATAQERRDRLCDEFFFAFPPASSCRHGGGGKDDSGGDRARPTAAPPDASRGVPCPECSAALRGPDKLLTAEAAKGGGLGGYIYLRGGGGGGGGGGRNTWACDAHPQDHVFPDDTAEVWGRHYARSHATIEADMIALARRVDASLDERGSLSRDVRELASRVDGVARLMGPRHAAVWRLRIAQAECHAGEAERLTAGLGPPPGEGSGGRMEAALAEVGHAFSCLDSVWAAVCAAPFDEEGFVFLLSSPAEEEQEEETKKGKAGARERVAAHALAHHAGEVCSLAREACALAAASPAEGLATEAARRALSERAQRWLARVEGPMRAARRLAGRGDGSGGAEALLPTPSDAERESARVREIVGQLQRLAASEGA